ncbi:MAG: ATP-binding cassette domain-containing protein [Magnetovibrio sp.]|nr:ATP-binding cassette domain-containing protein [Magnetovibrio sp.]
MSFFVNILALAVPVFTMQVYNRVVNNNGISTLQGLVVGMFLVIAFDYILRQSRARILQTVALRVDVDLGRRLFRKIMRLPMQNLEAQPSAYWSSLFRDVDVVRNTLSGSTALLVADLPFAILFLVLIFVIAAPVAWVLLIMLPVFMFVAWRSANVMSDASGQERKSTQTRDSLIAEMISGRTTIKALALDRSMEPVWEEKHAENIESAINRGSKTDSFSNLGASLGLVTSLCLTTVGALAIIDQNLTIGALIATNMLSGKIVGPMNQLVGTWRMYSGFMQATERLGTVFANSSEREESEVQLDRPKGALSVENVVFSYSEDLAPVVAGVTVDIKPGGIHALVGRNGSGKTTLLKIIQGLYQPQKGRVTLDGADMAQFTRSELADWLGYVPQESVLFAGTVRDNITARMPNATDEDVIKAATEAGVHHFIIDLPDGYATEIGEAGGRLSGGQRQRIAVARALVGDPPVVLLDEPSSSLDRHAETELKNTLVEISKTRTVIIVSHSPTMLSSCDYLYALDRGKLALAGEASEVLPRLFGGKGPAPKKTAPKNDGNGPDKPKGAPGGGKGAPTPNQKKPDGPTPQAAKAQSTATPKPAAKSPAPMDGLDKLAKSKSAKPQGKATPKGAATPRAAQVKATATPKAKVARPTAQAKQPIVPTQRPLPTASRKDPRSLPSLRGSSTAIDVDQPKTRSAVKASATPRVGTKGTKTSPLLAPKKPTVSKTSEKIGAATPSLRGPRTQTSLPSFEENQTSSSQKGESVDESTVNVGSNLRPSTEKILKAWAEGSTVATVTPRKGQQGRGSGARSRSVPTPRGPGSVGE